MTNWNRLRCGLPLEAAFDDRGKAEASALGNDAGEVIAAEVLHRFGAGIAVAEAEACAGESAFEELADENGFELSRGGVGVADVAEFGRGG